MTSNAIAPELQTLALADPISIDGLTLVPLMRASRGLPHYVMYTPVIADLVRVTEVSEDGVVQKIAVDNTTADPVLLLGGQELVGSKQNRIVATDILVAGRGQFQIPCACVEQGSWSYKSRRFSPASFASRSSRSKASAYLSKSVESGAAHSLDQHDVWQDVKQLLRSTDSASSTGSMRAAYDKMEARLSAFRAGIKFSDDAVGIAVVADGALKGLDIFDRASSFGQVRERLIDSYAIEWLAQGRGPSESDPVSGRADVLKVIDRLSNASWKSSAPPAGLGTEYRFLDESLTASALLVDGMSIHLQAFARAAGLGSKPTSQRPATTNAGTAPPATAQAQAASSAGGPAAARCRRCGFSYARVPVPGGFVCNHCGELET
jgi:hypothetical protein